MDIIQFGNEDKSETLKMLKELYEESEKSTKQRREKWKYHYNYWVNRQLSTKRPAYKSDIRVNYCWVVTSVKTPIMVQNRPTVNFVSFEKTPESESRADKYSKLVGNALWNKLKIQDKLVDASLNSQIYDAGFWKIGWDPSADRGIGEVFAAAIDPFKIFSDPAAKEVDDGRYLIHVEPYPVSYLKSKYKEYKDKIKPNKTISDILFEDRKFSDRKPSTSAYVTDNTEFKFERAYLKEYWISPALCDQSIEEVVDKKIETENVVDDFGNVIGQSQKETEIKAPKYRFGRVITTINDDCIVDDKPNPYNHGKLPFVRHLDNKVPNEFYGIGSIEQIIPLQDALNHAWQQIDDIANKTANVGWTVDPSLGKENIKKLEQHIDKPGTLKVVPLDKIRADQPPQIPQYLIVRIRDIIHEIGVVSGVTEILQGIVPKHRTARGIEHIDEAASSRIGLSDKLKDQALKDVAMLMAETAQQFYTEERVFALIGATGQISEVLSVEPEDLSGEFECSINSGTALPRDKASKADLVFNLLGNHVFEMALLENPALKQQAKIVLDAVEFPGREALFNWKPPAPAMPVAGANIPPGMGGGPLPTQTPPISLPPSSVVGQGGPPPAGSGIPTPPPEVQEMLDTLGLTAEQFAAMLTAAQ